ncbi:hypothetical protein [Acetobacter conturbans]|uniref:Formate hydrogenlyase subunit 4 n=1 Tax=Acetobacter conturbans TaxID=1737472 RepID=A0ABX0K0A1_9PROT|nr:hypothetical protein [Acetobacter conturbans]NHN87174.1 hypothetical protein [Acetobacter conturbans]
MTFSQIALAILLTGLQLLAVILLAPFLSGFRSFLSARASGIAAPPVLRRWFAISRLWGTLPPVHHSDAPPLIGQFLTPVVAPFSLAASLCAALLVPAFSLGLITASWSDLTLIALLLVLARTGCLLPALTQPAEASAAAFGRAVTMALVLPTLFLITALLFSAGATTTLAAVLADLSHSNPLVNGAPFVLAGAALLAAVDPAPRADTEADGQSSDDALLMLTRDIVALTWLTLAGDLIWPGSLARIAASPTVLSGTGAFLLGLVCWLVRCFLLGTMLAAGRAFVIGSATSTRLRGAAALLLALLALQLLTAARLMPTETGQPADSAEADGPARETARP